MRSARALALATLLVAFTAHADRVTPSTRLNNQGKTGGTHTSSSFTIPTSTWALISFCVYNDNGLHSPTAVSLNGTSATLIDEAGTTNTLQVALYKVSGYTPGSSKTIAYTLSATGTYSLVTIGVEYRDGNLPTYGAHGANAAASGTAATSALANSSGDLLLSTYCNKDVSGTPDVGTGQTKLDETDDTTSLVFYGFTTENATGTSDAQSVGNNSTGNLAAIASTVVTIPANPPAYTVAPAINSRTTSSIVISQTTDCTDCTAYFIAQADGLNTPTCTQIKAGNGADGNAAYKSASGAITANTQLTLTLSTYTNGTVRDGYGCLSSTAAGDSAVSAIADMYKIPAFSTPISVASTTNTAYTTNSKVLDGAGTVYLVGCALDATAPTVAQVENQTGGCIRFSASDDATGAMVLTVTDSPSFPAYDLYYVGTYGGQHEAAVNSLVDQCLTAPSGFQFVNCPAGLVSIGTLSVPEAYNNANFQTISYGSLTSAFTVGRIVHGLSSDAWGIVISDSGSALVVDKRSGSFANPEAISDASGGLANTNAAAADTPDTIEGDIWTVPTTVSPSSAALTVGTDGQFSYTAVGRQTALNSTIYRKAVAAYAAVDADTYFNNQSPACSGGVSRTVLSKNVAMSTDINSRCSDPDGDTLSCGVTLASLPPGLTLNPSTCVISGTPTAVDETGTAVDINVVDFAYATSTSSFLFVVVSVDHINCLGLVVFQCQALLLNADSAGTVTLGTGCTSVTSEIYSQAPAPSTTIVSPYQMTVFCR